MLYAESCAHYLGLEVTNASWENEVFFTPVTGH